MQSRKTIILFIFIICGYLTSARIDSTLNSGYLLVDDQFDTIAPEFKGGMNSIYKLIADNLVYPESALEERIGGKVETQFTIDTLGNVTKIKIISGIRDDIDKEAIRLIGLLNGWTPGTINNKKMKATFKLPLYFYPDNKFKRKYKKEHKNAIQFD